MINELHELCLTEGSWTVKVKTGDVSNGGTHAKVGIVVCGTKQTSEPIPLGEDDGNNFEPGNEAEFQIKLNDIGDIFKIRIEHDNSGDCPDWYLEKVSLSLYLLTHVMLVILSFGMLEVTENQNLETIFFQCRNIRKLLKDSLSQIL